MAAVADRASPQPRLRKATGLVRGGPRAWLPRQRHRTALHHKAFTHPRPYQPHREAGQGAGAHLTNEAKWGELLLGKGLRGDPLPDASARQCRGHCEALSICAWEGLSCQQMSESLTGGSLHSCTVPGKVTLRRLRDCA